MVLQKCDRCSKMVEEKDIVSVKERSTNSIKHYCKQCAKLVQNDPSDNLFANICWGKK